MECYKCGKDLKEFFAVKIHIQKKRKEVKEREDGDGSKRVITEIKTISDTDFMRNLCKECYEEQVEGI